MNSVRIKVIEKTNKKSLTTIMLMPNIPSRKIGLEMLDRFYTIFLIHKLNWLTKKVPYISSCVYFLILSKDDENGFVDSIIKSIKLEL